MGLTKKKTCAFSMMRFFNADYSKLFPKRTVSRRRATRCYCCKRNPAIKVGPNARSLSPFCTYSRHRVALTHLAARAARLSFSLYGKHSLDTAVYAFPSHYTESIHSTLLSTPLFIIPLELHMLFGTKCL